MRAFVDRVEGAIAVLLIQGRQWPVPRMLLPADAAEGSTVEIVIRTIPGKPPPGGEIDWKDR